MLVIHPKDKTTDMLSVLYEGTEHTRIDQDCGSNKLCHLLHHTPKNERIMLLGHGSDKGLFSRKNDDQDVFDRFMVNHTHAFQLRQHGANIVGVWCHANLFAKAEGLHGLFSGMIVTEMSEALLYEIKTTQKELDVENVKLAQRLRTLLDENIPLSDIPTRMRELDDAHTPLTSFNYANFHYL